MSFKVKNRIWIKFDDDMLLGKGRVALLKEIEQAGSLSKAAKKLNISYKKAWSLIHDVNKIAKQAVTKKTIGGKGGGGTVLTPYGKKLIEAYDEIKSNCTEFLDNESKKLSKLL